VVYCSLLANANKQTSHAEEGERWARRSY